MTVALLLIDVQRNMLEAPEPVPAAGQIRPVLSDLLARGRRAGATVVHIQNDGQPGDPDEPGTDGWQLVFEPEPDELVVRKDGGDAFGSDAALGDTLRGRGVSSVVVAGMQSEFCITDTTDGALEEGFDVRVVTDAHTTYDGQTQSAEQVARDAEGYLVGQGAKLVTAADVEFVG